MALISYKKYKCKDCGHEVEIQTNHFGSCYPICLGECFQIIEGSNKGNLPSNGGFRRRKQTEHICLENASANNVS